MASGDVYQVIDVGWNNDQQNLNVYFYRWDSLASMTDPAENLADHIHADLIPKVCAVQNTSFLHTEIRVKNIFNASDAFTKVISEAGTVTNADEAPIFLAINTTLAHDNPAVRQGRKAYGGLDEQQMANGIINASGTVTALNTLMTQLAAVFQEGIINTWFPIVVKRLLVGSDYVLPSSVGELVFGQIVDAAWDALVSSQNTRKTGRGI